jgi:hypothetical protein
MHSFRLACLVSFLLALAGCSSGDLCSRVRCGSGKVCRAETGTCVAGDGGTVVVDSGTPLPDGGAICNPACAAGDVCDPATLSCVACLTNTQCSCPRPVCDLTTHTCVALSADAGIVSVVPTIGETCADAQPLPFPGCVPATAFRVDLSPLKDDATGSCGGPTGAGHDAIFLVELDAGYDLRVTATPAPGSAAEPVTYLRLSPCDDQPSFTPDRAELVCSDGFGGTSSFLATSLPPGEYAIVIDAFTAGTSGPVDVTVELLAPTAPANETCQSPIFASLDGGTVSLDLAQYSDDLKGSCNGLQTNSNEAVFRVQLDAVSDFHAVVTPDDADGGADPVVYLRKSPCATGGEVRCIDQTGPGKAESLRARSLEAGTYFLVVEGYGLSGSGAIQLSTWATDPVPPPPNDTCAAPRLVQFASGSNTVSFTADTSAGEDDDHGSCSDDTLGGRELVYRIALPTDQTLTVTAVRTAGGSADPLLYLRGGGCSSTAGMELDCSDQPSGAATESISQFLSAGEYFLFVDSYSDESAGPTVVTVTLTP